MAISPRSTPGGVPGIEPATAGSFLPALSGNRRQHYPRHGFPPGIAMTALAPGRGRGRRPKAGRSGGAGEERMSSHLREGGNPLPGPLPPWRYSHGPLHGEIPEENRIGLCRHALPRPGWGRADGVGGAGKAYGYATWAQRGRGGGTEGSALWRMGQRPDMVCSSGIDAPARALPRKFGKGRRWFDLLRTVSNR